MGYISLMIEIKKSPKEKENYVNNKEFTQAVFQYVQNMEACRADSKPEPQISEYIGNCLIKIANGIAKRPNFSRYSYKEEMVLDALENCIKAMPNYKIETITRSGNPNAFAYFTQIAWYAFLRRIQKEKKQQEIKERYIQNCGIDSVADFSEMDREGESMVETIKSKNDKFLGRDISTKEIGTKIKERRKKVRDEDSSLDYFLE
jgi:DNA-directed RNA polymerase specialized sigma24 family protein